MSYRTPEIPYDKAEKSVLFVWCLRLFLFNNLIKPEVRNLRRDMHILLYRQAVGGEGWQVPFLEVRIFHRGSALGCRNILSLSALFGRKVEIMGILTKDVVYFGDEEQKAMGKRIQKRRKELGLYARDVAELLCISEGQYSRIERGLAQCRLEHLSLLAQHMELSTDFIIFGTKGADETPVGIAHLCRGKNPVQLEKAEKLLELFFS